MPKIGNADTFAAAAQLLQNSQRSGLSEKILGRQLFEVNADGSIRKQTTGEQIKSFGLRLVRQFDAHAQSKDALVGEALRRLHVQVAPGSVYARTGADLNGQLGRFFGQQPALTSRRPSIPERPPAALPAAFASSISAGTPTASAQRPAAALPPEAETRLGQTSSASDDQVMVDQEELAELLRNLPPEIRSRVDSTSSNVGGADEEDLSDLLEDLPPAIRSSMASTSSDVGGADEEDLSDLLEDLPPAIRSSMASTGSASGKVDEEDLSDLLAGLPSDVAERLKLPEVKPGTVRQNSDGSFPETAIGHNGRTYQLSVNRQSSAEARSALAWVNEQFKGRNPTMVGRALADAGIIEDFAIAGRAKRTVLEQPAILGSLTNADKQAFAQALQKRQAQAETQPVAQASYGAQMYQDLQSGQPESPIREAVANSRLSGHAEATERAFFLFDQALESTLSGMAGRDQKFPDLPPTRLSPDSLDGLMETAIREAAKEYKL